MLENIRVVQHDFKSIQVATLNSLFNELNARSQKYCVLRNYEGLPEYIGNDLDLLVSDECLADIYHIAKKIMHANGFRLRHKVERLGHIGMSFHHIEHDDRIVIDLLSKCVKLWYDYADCEYILQSRVKYKTFYVPLKGNVLYTVVLKDLLTYGFVRRKNDDLISTITELDRSSFLRCGLDYFPKEVLHSIFNMCTVRRTELNRLKLFFHLQKRLSVNNIITYIYYRVKELLYK